MSQGEQKVGTVDFTVLSTEALHPASEYLDIMSDEDMVRTILSAEDGTLKSVKKCAPEIARAARLVAGHFSIGGRLIYVGAGTSGRLGVLDAAECIPTFGTLPGQVVGVMAGGSDALSGPVEGAEDSIEEARRSMDSLDLTLIDVVCGIATSGVTPFVREALRYAQSEGIPTIFITCSSITHNEKGEPIADHLINLLTGPEIIAGSTRLKAGTATKLALNTLSTSIFVMLGKTYRGFMVDFLPTNVKLRARAVRIVQSLSDLSKEAAESLLVEASWNVKRSLVMHYVGITAKEADAHLKVFWGSLREIIRDNC